MKATPENKKIYWDSRARAYPRPFAPATLAKTRGLLRRIAALGVEFGDADILDIGCGTGVYALALANRARTVTGVDSSAEMLKIFAAEMRERGIANAACFKKAWSAVKPASVRGRYDVALASMTAAVRTKAEVGKMEAAARRHCVYIGWAGIRRNSLLEKVYAHHGVRYAAPEGAAPVLAALKALGRRPRVEYLYDAWFKHASIAETLADLEVNMKVNGAKLDRAWTGALLRERERGGKVRQLTRVRKAIIVWRPPAR